MPNGADFVGLFAPGAPRSSPLSRRFTNGTAVPGGPGVGAGSTDVAVPAGLAAGNYEVRLVSGVSGATLARMSVVLLVATNDTYTVAAARTLSVPAPGVLSNDTGTDVASLQATVVTNPGHGTLTLQPSGAFTYTPNIFFSGIDTSPIRPPARPACPPRRPSPSLSPPPRSAPTMPTRSLRGAS